MPQKSYKDKLLDARPDRLDLRDREYRPPLQSLPATWPLKKDYERLFKRYTQCDMVLDQGQDGACTGFGLAAVINYLLWRELIEVNDKAITSEVMSEIKVSTSMLYNMARIYDEWDGEDYEGSSCRGAMKGWHRHGVCRDKSWPFIFGGESIPQDSWATEAIFNPLGAYYRINKDSVVDMQAAIKEVGAIYCSATVHEGWWLKKGKSLSIIQQSNNKVGGHAFALVGYNADGFIVQNSWGTQWGYLGFAVLRYSDWVENGNDAWVAVRGAEVHRASSPHTFSSNALQSIGADYTKVENSAIGSALKYPYTHPNLKPWSEEKAYKHSLVIGNDGRAKRTLITQPTAEASATIICHNYLQTWMKKSSKNKKVVIYAHGGLNSEKDSINRIRIMAPYFKENGIYPLFVTWKTGFMESISDQIEDKINNIFSSAGISPSGSKAKGMLDKLQDAIDCAIENVANKIAVKGVWSEMKENAKYASDRAIPGYPQHGNPKAGGMVLMAQALQKLQEEFGCEIHLVGHSAGSILFGYWLDELTKRKMKVKSLTLYAPACTTAFANKHYINAFKKKTLKQTKTFIHMMDDERERADSVALYKKSLLYLVSRALEDVHKTPLLGMAASWNIDYSKKNDIYNHSQYADMKRWIKSTKEIRRFIYDKSKSQVKTSLRDDYTKLAHGSFDNDIEVIEQTIKQIKGVNTLKFRVENLKGF